jgi:hypothetical protein
MKGLACSILLLTGLATQALMAQDRGKFGDTPATPLFVFDDDGGRVQIVPPDFATTEKKRFHRGAVMRSVEQVSIFLGGGWGDAATRSREAELCNLGASGDAQFVNLHQHNISLLPHGASQEDFGDLSKDRVNDLQIQQKLGEMLQNETIPAPTASTVYVVYLAPDLISSLGAHTPGKDYLAYHNFVHVLSAELRYVVVPFDANADRQRAAASRALVEAALNPTGNGWY